MLTDQAKEWQLFFHMAAILFRLFAFSFLLMILAIANGQCGSGEDAVAAYRSNDFPRALQLARPAAQTGDPVSQNLLGVMYAYGNGVAKDPNEAIVWYRKAAEQGLPGAQTLLGAMYASGDVTRDYNEAAVWYRKAAEQGTAYAQSRLAGMYLRGEGVVQNDEEAIAWFRKAAAQDNANGQFGLGAMYEKGTGVAQDSAMAFSWLKKAAENGHPHAQTIIGLKYSLGMGVAKNKKASAVWYRKAAEQGFVEAQYLLGNCYEDAQCGLDRDDREALGWYQKAADQDYMPAQRTHKPGDLWDDARASRFERRKQPSPAAISAVSKDDVQSMIQTAVNVAAQKQILPPKTVHSDVDKPRYNSPENSNNYAVVIGVEKYASLPAADFAERDAEAVRAHLMALGYPTRNIYFLGGQQATRAKIAQSVNTWLPSRVDEKSTVFFYYSGHGAPDTQTHQAYLVPVDGDAEDLESTAFPIKQLYAKLGKLKAQQVIVALDSCFSGTGGRSVLAKGTRPLVSTIDLGSLPNNVIALTASDKRQISGTIEDQGHGAFTYYLLKGLDGAAQTDSGHITVRSLYDYLTPKVQDAARLRNRDQTPQLLPVNSDRVGVRLR